MVPLFAALRALQKRKQAIKAFHKLTYRKRVLEENKKKYSKSFHHDAWDVPDTSDAHKASLRGFEKVSLQESFDAVERSINAVQAEMKVDIKSVEDNLTKLIQPRTAEKEKAPLQSRRGM